jgi:ribosomal protein S21
MTTQKLTQAQRKLNTLIAFLEGRDYLSADKLAYPLAQAEREIERIVNDALDAVTKDLTRYAEEAYVYSQNRMRNLDGTPYPISKREQQKARTEHKRINATKLVLLELRF